MELVCQKLIFWQAVAIDLYYKKWGQNKKYEYGLGVEFDFLKLLRQFLTTFVKKNLPAHLLQVFFFFFYFIFPFYYSDNSKKLKITKKNVFRSNFNNFFLKNNVRGSPYFFSIFFSHFSSSGLVGKRQKFKRKNL